MRTCQADASFVDPESVYQKHLQSFEAVEEVECLSSTPSCVGKVLIKSSEYE